MNKTRAVTYAEGSGYIIAKILARTQEPHPVGYTGKELTGLCA